MHFREHPIILDEPKSRDFFPEKFGNEIYLSTVNLAEPVAYTSCFSIKISLKGNDDYIINKKKQPLVEGKFLVVNAGDDVICFPGADGEASATTSIFLEEALLKETWHTLVSKPGNLLENKFDANSSLNIEPFTHELNMYKTLRSFFFNRAKSFHLHPYSSVTGSGYFMISEMLMTHHLQLLNKLRSIEVIKLSTKKEIFRRINEAKDFINENVNGRITIADMAKAASMSSFHFIRCFRSIFKTTPHRYQNALKMEKAKEMLMKGMPINKVSRSLHYPDVQTFTKQFRRFNNTSPGKFKSSGS